MTDQEAAKKYAQEGLSYYSCVRVAAFIEGARYAREALEPKLKIAIEALEFYASCKGDLFSDFENDLYGELARESLQKIQSDKEGK